eukprot:Pgem_evm1s15563
MALTGFNIIDKTLLPTEETTMGEYVGEAAKRNTKVLYKGIDMDEVIEGLDEIRSGLSEPLRESYTFPDALINTEDGPQVIPASEIEEMDTVTREITLKKFFSYIKSKSMISLSSANAVIGIALIAFQIRDIKSACDSMDEENCGQLIIQSVVTAALGIGVFAAIGFMMPVFGEILGLALGIVGLITEIAKWIHPAVVPPHPKSVNGDDEDAHCQEEYGFIGISFLHTQNGRSQHHSIFYNELLSQDQKQPSIYGYGDINKLKSYLQNLKCDECMTAVKNNPFFKNNRTIYTPSINEKTGIYMALPCWYHCEKKANTVKYGITLTLDPLDQFSEEKFVAVSTESPNQKHQAYFKYQCIKRDNKLDNTIYKRYFTGAQNSGFFMQDHTDIFFSADVDNGEENMILKNIVKGQSGRRYFEISYGGGGNVTILDKNKKYIDYIGTKGYYCRLNVWDRSKKKYEANYIELDLPKNQCKNSGHFRTDEDYPCLKKIMIPLCNQYLDQFNNDAYLNVLPNALGFTDIKKPCAFSVPIFDRKNFENLNNLEDFKSRQAHRFLSRTRKSGTIDRFQAHNIFCSGNNQRIQIGNLYFKSGFWGFGGSWQTAYLDVIDFSHNNENSKVIEITSTDNHKQVNHNFVYRCFDGNRVSETGDIRIEAALKVSNLGIRYQYKDGYASNKLRLAVVKESNGYAVRYIEGGKVTTNNDN